MQFTRTCKRYRPKTMRWENDKKDKLLIFYKYFFIKGNGLNIREVLLVVTSIKNSYL